MSLIILIDQDGPLADWEAEFLNRWKCLYPELPCVELRDRRNFYTAEDDEYLVETPAEKALMRSRAESIYQGKGFLEALPVVEGAAAALNEMLETGHEVRICTSPLTAFRNCVLEKYEWVERHFGPQFTNRIILSKDKTLVRGDVLIDDHPNLQGRLTPTWTQILFDAPYNRPVNGRPRLQSWKDWPTAIRGNTNLR